MYIQAKNKKYVVVNTPHFKGGENWWKKMFWFA
jgi:hypothetical protein